MPNRRSKPMQPTLPDLASERRWKIIGALHAIPETLPRRWATNAAREFRLAFDADWLGIGLIQASHTTHAARVMSVGVSTRDGDEKHLTGPQDLVEFIERRRSSRDTALMEWHHAITTALLNADDPLWSWIVEHGDSALRTHTHAQSHPGFRVSRVVVKSLDRRLIKSPGPECVSVCGIREGSRVQRFVAMIGPVSMGECGGPMCDGFLKMAVAALGERVISSWNLLDRYGADFGDDTTTEDMARIVLEWLGRDGPITPSTIATSPARDGRIDRQRPRGLGRP